MSDERDGGPRDPDLGESDRGSSTPEVPIGGPREPMRLATANQKRGLLAYYLAVIAAVVALGAGHLGPLQAAPEEVGSPGEPEARAQEPGGGTAGAGAAAGRARPGAPLKDVLALVVLAGMLGGALHGLSAMEALAGRGTFYASWIPFHVARPFMGAGMALTVALVLGARMLGVAVDFGMHPRVLVGWGVMAGLFSTPALKKLSELFDVLFQPRPAAAPSGSELGARAPLIEAVAPFTVKPPPPPPDRPKKEI